MAKKRLAEQENIIRRLELTYLMPREVTPLDMGIIDNMAKFPDSNKTRPIEHAIERSRDNLKMLEFFFRNLKSKPRMEIEQSDEFQNFMKSVLDIDGMKFHNMTKAEKERANAIAVQLCSYSIKVMLQTMPSEFLKALKDSAIPLNNLLKGIYNYSKKPTCWFGF